MDINETEKLAEKGMRAAEAYLKNKGYEVVDVDYKCPYGQMRSVYATLSSEAGCLDSIVSKSMGHSGGSVKAKNYQKATLKALKMNAEIFGEYIDFKNNHVQFSNI